MQTAFIFAGSYVVIGAASACWWAWRTKERGGIDFIVRVLLWPVGVFVAFFRPDIESQRRESQTMAMALEAERREKLAKQERDRRELARSIEEGIRSADLSNELPAETCAPLKADLAGFGATDYNAFELRDLRWQLEQLWSAAAVPFDFVSDHFGRILAPNAEQVAERGMHYSLVGPHDPDTSRGEWFLALTREFMKSTMKIDRKLQGRILEALGEIAQDPVTVRGDTMKPLSHEMNGLWRYRLGDFRLIYQPVPGKRHILLLALAPRGAAYG